MTVDGGLFAAGPAREPMNHAPDASRRARGVELWAALKSLGRSGLCELVERTCALRSDLRKDCAGRIRRA